MNANLHISPIDHYVEGMTPEIRFWGRIDHGIAYLKTIPHLNAAERRLFRYHAAYWHWYCSMNDMIDNRLVKELRLQNLKISLAKYEEAVGECFQCLKINDVLIKVIMTPHKNLQTA